MVDMLNPKAPERPMETDDSPAAPTTDRAAPFVKASSAAVSEADDATNPSDKNGSKRWRKTALMVSLPLLLAVVGGYLWFTSGKSVSTDNAYVQQDKVSVSSEVGGRIVAVHVQENQRVKAGDLLYEIDPEPYRIAVDQALADLASAEAHVTTMGISANSMESDVETARRAIAYAQNNLNRETALMSRGFNTRARMDAAQLALSEAQGRYQSAISAAERSRAELATSRIAPGVNPGVLQARAGLEAARLQLARTQIRAPGDGIVTQTGTLQVGQMAIQGLPMMTIVQSSRSWVEANFKETDLQRMQPGMQADVEVDSYPGVELHGHVDSIGAGTGSEFSVLPAQNATGNWVKVTQRIPVRIAIDTPLTRPLRAGMTSRVTVHFNQNGGTTH